jgi:hypothetical protein
LHNQDRLFLVRPFKRAAAADLPVLIIPWDQVRLIRVLANTRAANERVWGRKSSCPLATRAAH